jgi:hypothetical protein
MMLFLFYRGVAVCRVGIAPGHTLLKKRLSRRSPQNPNFEIFPLQFQESLLLC